MGSEFPKAYTMVTKRENLGPIRKVRKASMLEDTKINCTSNSYERNKSIQQFCTFQSDRVRDHRAKVIS